MRLKYIVYNYCGLKRQFYGEDIKHPFNAKVRLYYVCNNSEFKKVSVSLRKLKHLSS